MTAETASPVPRAPASSVPGQVTLGQIRARGRIRAVLGLLGPAFVA